MPTNLNTINVIRTITKREQKLIKGGNSTGIIMPDVTMS